MQWFNIILLLLAGFAGGVANALAGGATIITFPAMIAAGLPPLIANASNAVAVTPGQLIAAIADKASLPFLSRQLCIQVLIATIGGVAGAFLLLFTPSHVFVLFVPALIGLATLLYAFSAQVKASIHHSFERKDLSVANIALMFFTTVYGGYFGAGQGIMLLAVLSLQDNNNPRQINALKNLLSSFVSAATLVIFVWRGLVQWPETLVMLSGAVCGGYMGARLLNVISAAVIRVIVITVGCFVSVIYAWRYWV